VENRDLSPAVSEQLYRILQEALTNLVKHSETSKGLVRLRRMDGSVELTVRDWGVGLDRAAQRADSLGFLSMRERCELLGGIFRVTSEPGGGTEVRATVPLRKR
jgi:signal transduction histidine kinase